MYGCVGGPWLKLPTPVFDTLPASTEVAATYFSTAHENGEEQVEGEHNGILSCVCTVRITYSTVHLASLHTHTRPRRQPPPHAAGGGAKTL